MIYEYDFVSEVVSIVSATLHVNARQRLLRMRSVINGALKVESPSMLGKASDGDLVFTQTGYLTLATRPAFSGNARRLGGY
jgi:hypothetical protein